MHALLILFSRDAYDFERNNRFAWHKSKNKFLLRAINNRSLSICELIESNMNENRKRKFESDIYLRVKVARIY